MKHKKGSLPRLPFLFVCNYLRNSSAMSKYTNFECKFICIRKIFVYFEYGVLPKARFLAAYAAKKAVKQPNRACMAELLLHFLYAQKQILKNHQIHIA